MKRWRFLFPVIAALALVGSTLPAGATHVPDKSFKMSEEFTSPNGRTNSDFAFWGKHAFVGYYSGSDATPDGGVRIFDISNPAAPRLVKDVKCDGLQADPIVWDRDGNGVADLLMLAVDRTMANPECGAPRTAHNDPQGWEGVRVFELSDDPANPFATVEQVAAVYTDCGAHTITLWPGDADEGRLLAYVSSYPLRPGPTCGTIPFTTGGPPPYQNTANPYDEDPGQPNNPLHGVIQVVEVPLDDPSASHELDVQPEISYPGDPDGINDWCERGLCAPGVLEPAAVACHDIMVHMEHDLAGAACAEQGQVWRIDEDGIPDTQNPILVGDDEVSSGGTGDIPGAVDFFHSVMFNNDGTVVNWVDESFGSGCPPRTTWQPRPWNPSGGTHQTGYMYFSDLETGDYLSRFHVGDVRPDPGPGEYCSAHMGMAVMGIKRDLLVNAWYTGGADVIDFTKPTRLKEIAYYDPVVTSGTWSAYSYTGPKFKGGPGIPIYASDGVTNNALAQGMVVYRTIVEKPGVPARVDHLNPQTMD